MKNSQGVNNNKLKKTGKCGLPLHTLTRSGVTDYDPIEWISLKIIRIQSDRVHTHTHTQKEEM